MICIKHIIKAMLTGIMLIIHYFIVCPALIQTQNIYFITIAIFIMLPLVVCLYLDEVEYLYNKIRRLK